MKKDNWGMKCFRYGIIVGACLMGFVAFVAAAWIIPHLKTILCK